MTPAPEPPEVAADELAAAERMSVWEYRITGDAGPDYPPYDFTWTVSEAGGDRPEGVARLLRETSAFRRNVTDIKVCRRQIVTLKSHWEACDVD